MFQISTVSLQDAINTFIHYNSGHQKHMENIVFKVKNFVLKDYVLFAILRLNGARKNAPRKNAPGKSVPRK